MAQYGITRRSADVENSCYLNSSAAIRRHIRLALTLMVYMVALDYADSWRVITCHAVLRQGKYKPGLKSKFKDSTRTYPSTHTHTHTHTHTPTHPHTNFSVKWRHSISPSVCLSRLQVVNDLHLVQCLVGAPYVNVHGVVHSSRDIGHWADITSYTTSMSGLKPCQPQILTLS